MGQMKEEQVLLFECQEEKESLRPDHQYGNGIPKQRLAVREDSQTFGRLYDLQASHAKIFSVLHKMKTTTGKRLQHIALW
jgi:hypothetical protein